MLVRAPTRVVANPTTIKSVGKNARNKLKAMAWAIMLQRGKTRNNIRHARLATAADGLIPGDYTCEIGSTNARREVIVPDAYRWGRL